MKVSIASLWLLLLAANTTLAAVLGIDFGEEYTKASLVAPGVPFEIVLSSDSKRKDTSGITFNKNGDALERSYGNAAVGLWTRFPQSSAFYYKPLLGHSIDDEAVSSFKSRQPGPTLVASNNNRSTIAYNFHDEVYPLEEVLAMTFSKVKTRAAQLLEANSGSGYVRDVAVAVPPHFTVEQRRAIEDAVEIAGLKLISLVNDGVAVAVNFASGPREFDDKKQYHVIYDVGAGSTVATLVSFRQGDFDQELQKGGASAKNGLVIDVEGVGFDSGLGGHTLTSIVRDVLVDKFLEQNPSIKKSDFLSDARALNKLWQQADKVKMVLSANTETSASIESLYKDIDFKAKVTRQEFEGLSENLVPQVSKPILDALSNPLSPDAKPLDISQVESIILTGGSVRVPFIKNELQNLVQDKVSLAKNVNADESAVLGATLRGVGISKIFKSKDIQVLDRTIWDYDMQIESHADGKSVVPLFGRGSVLGTSKTIQLNVTDDFNIDITENGRHVERFLGSKVAQTIKSVGNDAKKICVDGVVVEAEFTLTHSRTVELSSVYAQCLAKEKASSSSSSSISSSSSSSESSEAESEAKTDVEDVDASTDTTTAAPSAATNVADEKPPKPFKKSIVIKSKYNGPRPMGTASKQSSVSRLRSLDRQDSEREAKEEAKNKLETSIYRAREFLSDLDNSEDALEKLGEFTDWLDFDGQSAALKDLVQKQKDLEAFRKSFEPAESLVESATSVYTDTTASATVTATTDSDTDAAGSTHTPQKLGDIIRNSYKELEDAMELLKGAGLDPNENHHDLGLDVDKLDNYVPGGLAEESAKKDLEETVELMKEALKLADSDDDAKKSEISAKLKEQQKRFEGHEKDASSNQEKRIKALKQMIEDAAKSKSINEKMGIGSTTSSTGSSAATESIVHDDL